MINTIVKTDFNFPNQTSVYRGKVRDVYSIGDNLLVIIATDRISAFDKVLLEGIPYKGQILNDISLSFLKQTSGIVKNWLLASPHPNVAIGVKCISFKVEMVVRGYLVGHAWREYSLGKRMLCGVQLPDGLKENDAFPEPIITPTTKAVDGDHDEDISREKIISQNIVSEKDYSILENKALKLFEYGTKSAREKGLILADTKYEFGKTPQGKIVLIDEIHTPDSSRFFYLEGFEQRQKTGGSQKQLSKEFVRQWLIENGFQGLEGQIMPAMTPAFIDSITNRYIELYEKLMGSEFKKRSTDNLVLDIENSVNDFLNK